MSDLIEIPEFEDVVPDDGRVIPREPFQDRASLVERLEGEVLAAGERLVEETDVGVRTAEFIRNVQIVRLLLREFLKDVPGAFQKLECLSRCAGAGIVVPEIHARRGQ